MSSNRAFLKLRRHTLELTQTSGGTVSFLDVGQRERPTMVDPIDGHSIYSAATLYQGIGSYACPNCGWCCNPLPIGARRHCESQDRECWTIHEQLDADRIRVMIAQPPDRPDLRRDTHGGHRPKDLRTHAEPRTNTPPSRRAGLAS